MLFGGGHIYSSDDPIQGYKADPVNWAFHTDGQGVAFSRLWNVQGDNSTVLLTHQWLSGNKNMGSKGIYLAPLKQLRVGADGTPRVTYWKGNEKLKGDSISLPPLPPPSPPPHPPHSMTVVDVSGCSGPEAQWKLPSVGGLPATIGMNATACLGVEGEQVSLRCHIAANQNQSGATETGMTHRMTCLACRTQLCCLDVAPPPHCSQCCRTAQSSAMVVAAWTRCQHFGWHRVTLARSHRSGPSQVVVSALRCNNRRVVGLAPELHH